MSDAAISASHPAIALRPAGAGDRATIAALWHASAGLPGVAPPVLPSLAELRQRVDREMAAGWVVTLATSDDTALGFVAVRPREAVLAELFVHADALGTGPGRILLRHAMTAMPAGFTLYTRATNLRARHFYEVAGLVLLRHDTHPRTGDPVVHYRWSGAG